MKFATNCPARFESSGRKHILQALKNAEESDRFGLTTLHNQQFNAEGGGRVGIWGPPGGLGISVGEKHSAHPSSTMSQSPARAYIESGLSIKKWGETPHFLSLYWIAPILLKEARLARGGIREHAVFLGREIRSLAGTCDCVRWCFSG